MSRSQYVFKYGFIVQVVETSQICHVSGCHHEAPPPPKKKEKDFVRGTPGAI